MNWRFAGLFLLAVFAVIASGQDGAPPAPGKLWDWMIGEWKGDVEETYSHYRKATKATWRVERGEEFFLKLTYVSEELGQSDRLVETAYLGEGRQVYTYVLYSLTNRSRFPRVERGKISPLQDQLVLIGDPWDGVEIDLGEVVTRTTLTKKSNDEVLLLIERKDGKSWKKLRNGVMRRVKPAGRG
jgi:hypothetical protein